MKEEQNPQKEQEYIVVLSLGQLLNSNNNNILNELKNYIDQQFGGEGIIKHVVGAFSFIYSRTLFLMEVLNQNSVTTRFNRGHATWKELFEYIQKWAFDYSGSTLTEVQALEFWNSVCKGENGVVDQYIIDNIKNFTAFLENNPQIILVMPSNTNEKNWNCIKEMECMQPLINNTKQVKTSLSFEEHTSSLIDLTDKALKNLNKEQYKIISFHTGIKDVGEVKSVGYNVKDNGKISDYILKVIEEYEKEEGKQK